MEQILYDGFISYSRNDKELVKPIYQLLSFASRRIFWDELHIPPGDKWEHVIHDALYASRTLIILWCCDSAQSDYVWKEVELAVSLGKKLIPICLCGFPMRRPLSENQGINHMNVQHRCTAAHGTPPASPDPPGLDPGSLIHSGLQPDANILQRWEAMSAPSPSQTSLALSIYGLLQLQDRVGLDQGLIPALRSAGVPLSRISFISDNVAAKSSAVFGIYRTSADAELAVDTLVQAGCSNRDISVLMPDAQSSKEFAHEKNTKAPEGATTGAASGGPLAGIIALGMGIPEYEAKRYEGRVKAGDVLLFAHCNGSDEVARVKDVLQKTGAQDITSAGEMALS